MITAIHEAGSQLFVNGRSLQLLEPGLRNRVSAVLLNISRSLVDLHHKLKNGFTVTSECIELENLSLDLNELIRDGIGKAKARMIAKSMMHSQAGSGASGTRPTPKELARLMEAAQSFRSLAGLLAVTAGVQESGDTISSVSPQSLWDDAILW